MEYGCIGEKLSHSFSKEIHAGLADYSYVLREIPKDALDDFLTKRDFLAINVTIPYKTAVIPYLEWIEPVAAQIGAVNTVVNRNGKLYGYNTDFYGLNALLHRNKIELANKKVAVLGTGGTSRTACAVAKKNGAAKVLTVSRNEKSGSVTYEELADKHADIQVVINTTPCGMFPDIQSCPITIDRFPSLTGVADVVYNPLYTTLVQSARMAGISACNGLYMLVAQAARSSELFTGVTIDETKVVSIYQKLFAAKQNIVLIGMPGCGKTTVGKLLGTTLDRPIYDSDVMITEKYARTPSQIIHESGEPAFRKIEQEIICGISGISGAVIATGGGVVLSHDNVLNLKKNGRLFFIDRSLSMLPVTKDRPLSSTEGKMKALYDDRIDFYKNGADFTVDGNGAPIEVAEQIVRRITNETICD